MAERLEVIRLPVQRWADWEPDNGGQQGHAQVAAHYPGASCVRVSALAPGTQEAKDAGKWWQRFRLRRQDDPVVAAPPEGSVQLVWANMLAHQVADPGALLAAWHHALAVDGFVMFSCLGPDTLKELRALYARLGWPPPAQAFTDMHDWGDQLIAAGFAEPVMDMETVTLTFETPERLLTELRGLGRNLHGERFAGLRTPAWRERLLQAMDDGLRPAAGAQTGKPALPLSFELIYGHALKPAARHAVASETAMPLQDMRSSLKKSIGNFPPV